MQQNNSFSVESMYPLYLSYSSIVSLCSFILKNRSETYFVLVLILLALVTCLCWYIWLGKTRRENELAQQQQAVLVLMEERIPFSSNFEAKSLIQKYGQQVDKNRKLIKEIDHKSKEVEKISAAKRELDDSYEQLKDILSKCEAKRCTLNKELKQKCYELGRKNKNLEETSAKVEEMQNTLEKEQNNSVRMQEDLKYLQEELAREQDEKRIC